jgi:hypothetical protein
VIATLAVACLLSTALSCAAPPGAGTVLEGFAAIEPDPVPTSFRRLSRAYPELGLSWREGSVRFASGTALRWDDGYEGKTLEGLLDRPDLEGQCSTKYPAFAQVDSPGLAEDPGRARVEGFFRLAYGASEPEVEAGLTEVLWLPTLAPRLLPFSRRNGAADALKAVSDELDAHPEFLPWLGSPGGTFSWRYIDGTARRSPHAYGIAIDIDPAKSAYWRGGWSAAPPMGIPAGIVEIFERHRFAWGGRWAHFDTMHFEYRPELFPFREAPDRARTREAP